MEKETYKWKQPVVVNCITITSADRKLLAQYSSGLSFTQIRQYF